MTGRRTWRAGDHHVHSEYSGGYDTTTTPTTFVKGADAIYPVATNALMARRFGLSWVMCTDHGGPDHSRVNLELAYPDLLRSRRLVPEVLQFWGMEFDTPAMDHHTLMVPHHDGEAEQLFKLESRFSKLDAFPPDPSRDTESAMTDFLTAAGAMARTPLMIAHHAARSAPGLGYYGQDTPRGLRANNDAAPDVYVGFEGAPGHQAGPLVGGRRGAYGNHPTYGGFDQMTARVGGLWDSLLGDGRRWWITATSDSHVHWTRGGSDFWPGEYSKTYVFARQDYGGHHGRHPERPHVRHDRRSDHRSGRDGPRDRWPSRDRRDAEPRSRRPSPTSRSRSRPPRPATRTTTATYPRCAGSTSSPGRSPGPNPNRDVDRTPRPGCSPGSVRRTGR